MALALIRMASLATNTKDTLVVLGLAVGLNQAISATVIHIDQAIHVACPDTNEKPTVLVVCN